MSKRKREEQEGSMEIVWQTPANPPEPHDYVFRNGNQNQNQNLALQFAKKPKLKLGFCFPNLWRE